MRIPSGVTDQYVYFMAVDATDFSTPETGLTTFTVYRSRNGAAAAAMTTPTVAEVDATNLAGVYSLLLDEDMTIDAGDDSQEMVFYITHAGMAPVVRTIELYRPKITAGYTLGVASDGDLLEVNTLTGHTAQTGDNYARLGAPAGASIAADIATVDTVVDGIQTDLDNATDGLGALKILIDAIQTDLDNGTDGLGALKTAVDANGTAIAALNDISVADVLTTAMTEAYNTDGSAPTLAQAVMLTLQVLTESSISGTTMTVKKLDGSTTAATFTLDSAGAPTSITRAT